MWQHDFNVVLTLGIFQVLMWHISGDETLNGTYFTINISMLFQRKISALILKQKG